jgi:hypothetical protein
VDVRPFGSGHSRYGPTAFARGRQKAANSCQSRREAAPGRCGAVAWGNVGKNVVLRVRDRRGFPRCDAARGRNDKAARPALRPPFDPCIVCAKRG